MSKELSGIVKALDFTIRKAHAIARKKRKAIFARMSVAHVDDELDTPGEVYHAEKVLFNGDMYTGQWADNCPNGQGKYLWSDGCMYVGDWANGKPIGKGRFSWPSGATYEGQFKNGYMDGEGIYTGCSNDAYRGSWVYNMRHGRGSRYYPNGDRYVGEWRRGQLNGQGKYQWSNGNQYIGQWRNGKMYGNGTILWSNGSRFDGCWEDGEPKGNGTFRWEDGSFYVGIWSRDSREQSGTYYPSSIETSIFDWDPQDVYSVYLVDCKADPGEKITIFPSQKMINWPCEGKFLQKQLISKTPKANSAKPPGRKSVDGGRKSVDGGRKSVDGGRKSVDGGRRSVDGGRRSVDGGRRSVEGGRKSVEGRLSSATDGGNSWGDFRSDVDNGLDFGSNDLSKPLFRIQPPKRQGETISKGHRNYELMLNLQLGVRHSVGRPAPATSLELKATAFDTKDKIWTRFPPEGSKQTPPHQSCDFKWKDYCPLVFRTLRKCFKVDPADYMLSICGNDALRELSSPGKSGSFFYLTNDDKYMIKTMKKSEVKVLLRMLPAYYNHVRAFENTLVTKFFGLHCVKMIGTAQKKVRFVIMGNLFCTEYVIHRRYDLKGSSLGRVTDIPAAKIDSTTTLKDLDLNFIFRLQKVWFQEFCRQVDHDSDFLEQERIMDYSLLVGVHFREVSQSGEPLTSGSRTSGVHTPSGDLEGETTTTPRISRADKDLLDDPSRWASMRLGINTAAKAELTAKTNICDLLLTEPTGQYYDVILFFGIIDILQDYDISKKLEHAYKSFQYDSTSISAVDPRLYSHRFRNFIFKVFAEDT